MSRRREQLIPEEDWQRAIRRHLEFRHRVEMEAQYANYRPRFVMPMADLTPYQEMFRRFAADVMADRLSLDAQAHDVHPDRCWRCDASPSADDLGLCEPCRVSLTKETT